jgi:hypothetical protein
MALQPRTAAEGEAICGYANRSLCNFLHNLETLCMSSSLFLRSAEILQHPEVIFRQSNNENVFLR